MYHKFCIQYAPLDENDVWLQHEANSEAEIDDRVESMIHVFQMMMKACKEKNMEIHLHMKEVKDDQG